MFNINSNRLCPICLDELDDGKCHHCGFCVSCGG